LLCFDHCVHDLVFPSTLCYPFWVQVMQKTGYEKLDNSNHSTSLPTSSSWTQVVILSSTTISNIGQDIQVFTKSYLSRKVGQIIGKNGLFLNKSKYF
jgi:hypothetical protein